MLKALKVRIYPNNNQVDYLNNLLGSYRFVFNSCLNLKKNTYIESKQNLGLKELGNYFHQELTKNPDYVWLNDHNTKVLKQSILNLMESYKRFFVNGNGFPKFKSKYDTKQSCRFPLEAISKKNDYLSNHLNLTKELKNLKFKCSDKYKNYLNQYKEFIKSATLTKSKSGNYHLSILIDLPNHKQLPQTDKVIGIDLGIKDFIVDSDGNRYENLKTIRTNQRKISKLQRRLSKKVNKSKNKDKQRIKLAKYHEKLNNIKTNYLHQISNKMISENQVICMEDLNVSGMMKNHMLSKSIQELSLNNFTNMLKYKAIWNDRDLIQIDRYFPSSKLCNVCKTKNDELTLKDREWQCKSCQAKLDRDINASINILNEGMKLYKNKIPIRNGKSTPLETSGYAVNELGKRNLRSFS